MTARGRQITGTAASRAAFVLVALFISHAPLAGQSSKVYTYVGRITSNSFLLGWGDFEGDGNTIGRNSVPLGSAVVEVDGRRIAAERNWVEVAALGPDRTYPYRLLVNSREVSRGQVRTFPEKADRLAFFIIGDFGSGRAPQYAIARVMQEEFEKRAASDNPIRFVLTTGDNIYSDGTLGLLRRNSGARDRDWKGKFFEPYEQLLRHTPFYPTIGNHDRDESKEDFPTYLDNFFFPGNEPAPYYSFSFGGLADFFALDTTALWTTGAMDDSLAPQGGQFRWLQSDLAASRSPWKIAYFHHPPFSAGPRHEPAMSSLLHVVEEFRIRGVQAAFSGHEHNFQVADRNAATGQTLYVVSGAGGQLRTGGTYGRMAAENILGTSPQRHFLVGEIEGETMRITPLSSAPMIVRDKARRPIAMPLVVHRSK